ncbi:hypothetical protein ACIGZH_01810 [Streptomyces sp. NPDC058319]|uniref:hypothetical protein n=1 Tax=unclassified Streptomyces TaxID=2593676 RepID=UPI0036E9FD2D
MTPADELRAAAATLRALATAASTDTDGTPTAHWHHKDRGHDHAVLYGDHLTSDDVECISWPLLLRGGSLYRSSYMHVRHAEYAATMGPVVGLALATLLEGVLSSAREAAPAHEECASGCSPDTCDLAAALAVARAINGGEQR